LPATTSCGEQVLFNTINSNGTLGASWTTASTAGIPGFRCDTGATIYNGRIYLVGGWTGGGNGVEQCDPTVRYATINPATGRLSAWTTSPNSTSTRRGGGHSVTVYNGYMYVSGGYSSRCGGSQTFTNAVEIAQLNTDGNGAVGTFSYTSPFPVGHGRGQDLGVDGYMYSIAGQDEGTNPLTSYRRAPVLSNGQLGVWEKGGTNLSVGRVDAGVISYGGKFFVIGGYNLVSTYYSSIESTYFNSIPRSGSYSRPIDFGSGIKPTKLITRGSGQTSSVVDIKYRTTNNTAVTFDNTQHIVDTGYGGTNAQSLNLGTNVSLSRYLWIKYSLDDTASAAFPDSANRSTITDYDIYFTANPGSRLKGGRTFTNGGDRGLDAAP
jgi:hypothetical protein